MASKRELYPLFTDAQKKTRTNSKDMDELPAATRILIETLKNQLEKAEARAEKAEKELKEAVKEERARGEKAVKEERDRAEKAADKEKARFERIIKHGLDRACSTIKHLADNATKAQVEATPLLHRTSAILEDNQRQIVYGCQGRRLIQNQRSAKFDFLVGNERDVEQERSVPTEAIVRRNTIVKHITKFKSVDDPKPLMKRCMKNARDFWSENKSEFEKKNVTMEFAGLSCSIVVLDDPEFGSAQEFCKYFFDGYPDVLIRDKSYFGVLVYKITEIICKTFKGSTKRKSTVKVLRRGLVQTASTLRDNSNKANGIHDEVDLFRFKAVEEGDLVQYAERVLEISD